jgi:hypothetical protein
MEPAIDSVDELDNRRVDEGVKWAVLKGSTIEKYLNVTLLLIFGLRGGGGEEVGSRGTVLK